MDEHVQRVCEPLLLGWNDFVAGRATLADLSRLAGQARQALDSSADPLPDLLWTAELELLALRAQPLCDQRGRASDQGSALRYVGPIVEQIGHRI